MRLALSQLAEAHLLVGVLPFEGQEPRQSRRVLLRRMAVAGGVALPLLVSVSAPTAAVASSHCGDVGQPCCPSSTGCLIGTCKTFGLSCQQGTCQR